MYKRIEIVLFVLLVHTKSLIVNANVPEGLEDMAAVLHSHCVKEIGVAEALIEDAKSGKFSEDRSFKCYLHCLYAETGLITDDGKLDADGLISVIPEASRAKYETPIRKCNNEAGSDECDTMFLTTKCFYAQDPANFFMI